MKEHVDRISQQGSYLNSRRISLGGIPFTMRDVLVTAPLIAGLNVYLIGGTGEGKTQLSSDLAGLFGESTCIAEGRPDFELSDLFKQLNLSKLRDAVSDQELVELTGNVDKCLYYVDELNRCPPIVQNYFFNFFDGKLVHRGKIFRLGKHGYSVGYASGNIGDGAYVGISDVDRALKDRMHLIMKVDDPALCTTENDDGEIFENKKDPRATMPQADKGALESILALHQEFRQQEVPLVFPALGVFLHKGLDYLENTGRHSKRALDQQWPNVKGIRPDSDEGCVMPLSKRAVLGTLGLTQALKMIAEANDHEVKGGVPLFLDAMQFTVPYSGVLSPAFIAQEHGGDAYSAYDAVFAGIAREVTEKTFDLEAALVYALQGIRQDDILSKIASGEGRWMPVRRYIEGVADTAAKARESK